MRATEEFFNQSWRSYTGLSLEELKANRNITVHPEDLAATERAWRTDLATGEPFQHEQRERRADGEYRWHTVRRVPARDESGAIVIPRNWTLASLGSAARSAHRSSTRATTIRISISAKLAPRQRRVPPPNGIHV